jgi:hypothetical protein
MFCPDGFVTLFELRNLFVSIAKKQAMALRGEFSLEDTHYGRWIFLRFVTAEADKMYASLDNGKVVKLVPDVLALRADLPEEFALPGLEYSVDYREKVTLMSDAFFYLDSRSMTIDLSSRQVAGITRRDSLRLGLSALSSIEGSPVCWRKPSEAISAELLYKIAKVTVGFGSTVSPKRGRPAKQQDAVEAYRKCFPNGHGSLRWEEVRRVLQREAKFDGGIRTLIRALGKPKVKT